MNEKLKMIAQSYCGMTPKDKGCTSWDEMHQQMADEIIADIRNKLSPIKNLITMLENQINRDDYVKFHDFVEKEIENSKQSIKYLSGK